MSSKYKACIFDLFGTLVNVFSATEHEDAVTSMANILEIPRANFAPLWNDDTWTLRATGVFSSIEENLAHICHLLSIEVTEQQLAQAAKVRYEFTRIALRPKGDAIETLQQLKRKGFKTGLISNCAADVTSQWLTTPLAPCMDAAIFSCDVGLKKPDQHIYQIAFEKLQVSPEECLYVGDGSDRELTGAKKAGMHPILIIAALSDAYDIQRPDVTMWNGKAIGMLKDVLTMLE